MEEQVDLRKVLARDEKLAMEISEVLSKYQFDVPGDKIVVWAPTLVDKPKNTLEAWGILVNGIPHPRYLEAAHRFNTQFRI